MDNALDDLTPLVKVVGQVKLDIELGSKLTHQGWMDIGAGPERVEDIEFIVNRYGQFIGSILTLRFDDEITIIVNTREKTITGIRHVLDRQIAGTPVYEINGHVTDRYMTDGIGLSEALEDLWEQVRQNNG